MNLVFRLLLTFNATSWMIVIYAIKSKWTFCIFPVWAVGVLLLLVPVVLSLVSIWISKFLGEDHLSGCEEFSLADNEFLPTYLGYFFVSLSASDLNTMSFLYAIVFVFTYLSQTQYFNPIFLLFGYHYYHILTPRGSRVFIICRGKIVRNRQDIAFSHLRRINDTTYIERRRRKHEQGICKTKAAKCS